MFEDNTIKKKKRWGSLPSECSTYSKCMSSIWCRVLKGRVNGYKRRKWLWSSLTLLLGTHLESVFLIAETLGSVDLEVLVLGGEMLSSLTFEVSLLPGHFRILVPKYQ